MTDEFFTSVSGMPAGVGGEVDPQIMTGHMWAEQGAGMVDLGPATVSSNDDGVLDTCTVATDHDITVYTDTDHDGVAEYAYRVDHEGHYERWHYAADEVTVGESHSARSGGHGHWEIMDSGQLL